MEAEQVVPLIFGRERRLRVAMVLQRFRPYFSGQGVQVEELCKALARLNVDATIVTATRDTGALRVEQVEGSRIFRLRCDLGAPLPASLKKRLWSPVFAIRTLAHLWRHRGEIDLIHVHALTDALYTSWLFARMRGIPILFEMTLMGADDAVSIRETNNLFPRLRFGVFRRCNGYVAISPALAHSYEAAGLPDERLRVIPQGVDPSRFTPVSDKRSRRQELGLPAEGPLLVFVGSLVERKGIDLILAAWSRIHRVEPRSHLVLVGREDFPGDPAAQRYLEQHLSLLDPEAVRNLHRFGLQDEPERFLGAADVFLFPSRREGFGTVIIEAMACGLPSVVAELPGITDFIFRSPASSAAELATTADGVVVPQEDPVALAEMAIALISDPKRAGVIGAAARERAERKFGFETIARAYLDFYAELLGATNGRPRAR